MQHNSTPISVAAEHSEPTDHTHWQIADLDFDAIDRSAIEDNEDLFYLLMSASFIETGSDTYAANLAEHYSEYPEITAWLRDRWESEELQHGLALRKYVENVWPDFPWEPSNAPTS